MAPKDDEGLRSVREKREFGDETETNGNAAGRSETETERANRYLNTDGNCSLRGLSVCGGRDRTESIANFFPLVFISLLHSPRSRVDTGTVSSDSSSRSCR